ncbi:hypothetical protein [Paenibacillus terrae]|uniref:Uncharacterized protein n=1 Tax=Paenibacillus terrae TaxID=159743 RepID=A0A0D7WXU2_9BACL|nr:hypothetical protein [Paenibacillus terrae]KJD43990.1 hypothetical protein QD47_19475 [Paenibacillus terrae]
MNEQTALRALTQLTGRSEDQFLLTADHGNLGLVFTKEGEDFYVQLEAEFAKNPPEEIVAVQIVGTFEGITVYCEQQIQDVDNKKQLVAKDELGFYRLLESSDGKLFDIVVDKVKAESRKAAWDYFKLKGLVFSYHPLQIQDPITSKIEIFNQKLMAMDASSEDYKLVDLPTELLLTKEKLDAWKKAADAGALIVGGVDCRYLIVVKEVKPIEGGLVDQTYGFLNIDDAGWTLCEPSFPSTDELIEWFAFNLENPIVEVISSNLVEYLLSPDAKIFVELA